MCLAWERLSDRIQLRVYSGEMWVDSSDHGQLPADGVELGLVVAAAIVLSLSLQLRDHLLLEPAEVVGRLPSLSGLPEGAASNATTSFRAAFLAAASTHQVQLEICCSTRVDRPVRVAVLACRAEELVDLDVNVAVLLLLFIVL